MEQGEGATATAWGEGEEGMPDETSRREAVMLLPCAPAQESCTLGGSHWNNNSEGNTASSHWQESCVHFLYLLPSPTCSSLSHILLPPLPVPSHMPRSTP